MPPSTLIRRQDLPSYLVWGASIVLFFLVTVGIGEAQLTSPYSLDISGTNSFDNVRDPASAPDPVIAPTPSTGTAQAPSKYVDILRPERQGYYDEALNVANGEILANPKDIELRLIRGHIYTEMFDWEKADADFQAILKIDPNNLRAQFNRSEVRLEKKDYDGARAGFLALEKNPELGDLATYKVFLCDLLADHEDAARAELAAFVDDGSHPSYYYANATWCFLHKQHLKAQSLVDSAERIFPARTRYLYSYSLVASGYLPPLPPAESP